MVVRAPEGYHPVLEDVLEKCGWERTEGSGVILIKDGWCLKRRSRIRRGENMAEGERLEGQGIKVRAMELKRRWGYDFLTVDNEGEERVVLSRKKMEE